MDFDELEQWISQQREKGFSDEDIRSHLREEGFSDQDIDQAFDDLDRIQGPETEEMDDYSQARNQGPQSYGKSGDDFQQQEKDQQTQKTIVKDFTIENSFRKGLSFFRSDGAKKSFLYLFSASFLLALLAVGIGITEESGPLLGFLGTTPLSVGLFIGLIALGIAYVKFFRIILSEVNVDLEPMSSLGAFLALLRLGAGYIFYAVAVLAGLVFFILPGIYIAQRLFFFNYGVMQGHGLIHSLKKSWRITEGRVLKVLGLSFTASILGSALGLVFEAPAELMAFIGYSNLSILVSTPGTVISSMATVAVLGAAYGMMIADRNPVNTE